MFLLVAYYYALKFFRIWITKAFSNHLYQSLMMVMMIIDSTSSVSNLRLVPKSFITFLSNATICNITNPLPKFNHALFPMNPGTGGCMKDNHLSKHNSYKLIIVLLATPGNVYLILNGDWWFHQRSIPKR